ncbi:MAG: DUF2510 domain-containing protein [Solirubrobacteraceae bacterium]
MVPGPLVAFPQQRYWDGERWIEHTAPASAPAEAPQPSAGMRPCPYCTAPMPVQATRCPTCTGELRHRRYCGGPMGVATRQKFVGMVRGGMKTQSRCLGCNRILDGPRW